ncbi:MAG: TolC family protein [Phycisphaerales bacterium]|nr:MAG: TolC family protein [Phycisphaerales bacterium]
MQKVITVSLSAFVLAAFTGCATVDPRPDYQIATEQIFQTTGQKDVYHPGDDEIVARKVKELLRDGITANQAVQICLLNNPSLQAAFYEIGMARADVVQSGLLSNPSLGLSLRLPAGGGLANLEADLAQNIADLWQIPVRKRIARHKLNQVILQIARQAADLAADAKISYYDTVGTIQLHEISKQNVDLAQQLLDMTLARQKAGEASALDVNLSRSFLLEKQLDAESARLAAADARRNLARILGITQNADQLDLKDCLPEIPPKLPDAERLIELACVYCLDMQAARQAVAVAESRLEQEYRRIFPTLEVGLALERSERQSQGGRDILADTARASIANGGLTAPKIQPRSERRRNTDFIIGPSLGMELPIFDQNQAQIAKARYAYEQAVKTAEGLRLAAYQEVRSAVDNVLTTWKLAQTYRDRSLPLAQNSLKLSMQAYRAGQASFLAVLEAERFSLNNRSQAAEAARTAAITIADMERTMCVPFDKLIAQAETETKPITQPDNTSNGADQ